MRGKKAKRLRQESYNHPEHGMHDFRVRQHAQLKGQVVADPIRQRYKKRKREKKDGPRE